ncbi:MAG: S46 family peptidase [Ignavibacteria bacterium]|nr:S46 family peptidase [Ignavibacteria bacterium]
MNKYLIQLFLVVALFFLFAALTFPDEGMWLMTQLEKLPFSEMRKHGLMLSPEQIYSTTGTSIKDAIVLLPGGTGSFVSAEGLIITNHHIAFGAIQSVSTVEEDYLKNGFYAKSKAEEISVPTYTARMVTSIKDVTSDVLNGVSDTMSASSRQEKIQANIADIQNKAKTGADMECTVSETYNGVKYFLYCYDVVRDIRLVYAPPSSIGNYGGEVDNWYWPRHTGDFGFMRAYVAPDGKAGKYSKDNVPYKPRAFLPVSAQGVTENSFAMILGFPGRTFRYRTSAEIQLSKDETLPLVREFFRTRMDIIEAAGKKDRAVEIKYASKWRGMANTYKNYEGTLEGMKRSNIISQRLDNEKKFQEFLQSKPELQQKYGSIMKDIVSTYENLKSFNKKQIVMGQLIGGSDLLGVATRFMRFANSFAKDSTGEVKPSDKSVSDMKEFLTSAFKDVDANVDKELLTALILKAADLPYDQHIDAVQRITGPRIGEQREKVVKEYVNDLYKHSKITSKEDCERLITKSSDDIRDDDFIKLAISLDKDNAQVQTQTAAFNGKIGMLRGKLLAAYMEWKGPDLYPDATRTLRLTYGEIKSYVPRDAVHYNFETMLGGVMEKETGEDPFIVPQKLHELWEKKDFGRYADPLLHDVPVAFIGNLDITGGNSGSPVINGKGELIGVAFDGNWEAVVGDYLFQAPLNRSINVDTRYVLFLLDKFSNAQNILSEMVIH